MKGRKNQLKRIAKQEAGVTITAMIIAVILVIILAAISITSVLDEERDIFGTAYEARTGIEVSTYQEELEVIKVNCTTNQLNNGLTASEYIDLFKESVEKDTTFDGSTVEKKSSSILRIETEEGYVFIITADGAEYVGISGEFDETYSLTEDNVTFTYTPSYWTNENVTVEISLNFDIGDDTFQYSTDGETWYDYEEAFEVETNTEIYVMYSTYGDDYVTGEVTNIDKLEPTIDSIETTTNSLTFTASDSSSSSYGASGIVGYLVTQSSTTPTSSSSFTDCTDEEGNGVTSLEITVNELKQNTTYYVYVIDDAGNISSLSDNSYISSLSGNSHITISSVPDLTEYNVEFTQSEDDWTNEDVIVYVDITDEDIQDDIDDRTYTLEYSIDGGETWEEYDPETGIPVDENTEIEVRLSDGDNTGESITHEVDNIDKTAPEVELEVIDSTTNSITVEVTVEDLGDDGTSDSSSGIASYEFQISTDGETWETVEIIETSEETYTYTYEGLTDDTTYYVRVIVKDVAGNETTSDTEEVTLEEVPGGEDPSGEYDDEGIEIPTLTFEYSTTEWTNEDVTVTIVVNGDTEYLVRGGTYIIEYNTEDPTDEASWTEYTEDPTDEAIWTEYTAEVETNGSIYARLSDGTNVGDYATGTVSNIDKTAPEVELEVTDTTTNSITVEVTAEDLGDDGTSESASGILRYDILISTDGWAWEVLEIIVTSEETYTYTYEGLSAGTAYYLQAIVADNAGNCKMPDSITGETDENLVLDITTSYSTTSWTNENVTVTASTDTSYTIQYSTDGTNWTEGSSYEMSTNSSVYFRLASSKSVTTDYATGTVSNIDKISPEVSVLRTFPERITFDGEDTESDEYGLSGIVGYMVTTSTTTPTATDTWTELIEATQYEFGDSITDGGYATVREKETDLTDETTYYIYVIDEAGNISSAVNTTTLAYTAIDTDGDESSYIGYYADIDDDLPIEGVIYADLAYSVSGSWTPGFATYTFSYSASSSSLRDYYVCDYNGDFTEDDVDFGENYVITSMPSTSGSQRFYALELSDHTTSSYSTFYWYYNAWSKISDSTTSGTFGKGLSNTEEVKAIWDAGTYTTSDRDMWAIVDIGTNIGETDSVWYIPSIGEYAALGDAFEITSSNRTTFGLQKAYWSSTLYEWDAYHTAIGTDEFLAALTETGPVRLGATF